MFGLNNEQRNKFWTKKFDKAFRLQDISILLQFINKRTRLRPFFDDFYNYTFTETSVELGDNEQFPINKAKIISDIITLEAQKNAHIQVHHSALGNLFIEKERLAESIKLTPEDKDIISGGVRGFDPFDQADWVKIVKNNWITAPETREPSGVCTLSFDKKKRAIFLDTPPSIIKAYGTKPRAISILDSENNSIIFAFQQENFNKEFDFAAWSVLPFEVVADKKTLCIFKTEKNQIKQYQNANKFESMRTNPKWKVDGDRFFIIDISKSETKTEYLDPYVDWCAFVREDSDAVILLRSCYGDKTENNQFRIFSAKKYYGGSRYIEAEFIAPKVGAGEKSTLIYRLDFISLNDLEMKAFDKNTIDDKIVELGDIIDKRISKIKNQYKNYFL